MRAPWPHTAAILAGGESRRMGRTKASLPWSGEMTMLGSVAEVLRSITASVILVGGDGPACGLDHLPDRHPGRGPIGGLETLCGSGLDDRYLVCPCDMPGLVPGLLQRLLSPVGGEVVIFASESGHPVSTLPMVISADVYPVIAEQVEAGDHALHRLLQRVETVQIALSGEESRLLVDIDDPGTYEKLRPRA